MKFFIRKIKCLITTFIKVIVLFFISKSVFACDNISGAFTSSVTLQGGNFSAGQDMNVGTIIRIQKVNAQRAQSPGCAVPSTISFTATGGLLYPGSSYIYQTGIDGLGVRFETSRASKYYFGTNTSFGFSGTLNTDAFGVNLEFVVMGPISGGVINSTGFPTLNVNVTDGYGNQHTLATYKFSGGSFNVTVPTCITPDYTYELGNYGLSNFSAGTQVSPWMDTPITLTNCPVFYGNNSNSTSYTNTNQQGLSPTLRGTVAPNVLSISLKPNTAIIDAAKGIFSLDSGATATGVAVQVSVKQAGNNFVVQNLNNAINITTTAGVATSTYSLPLAARIVRSTGELNPGNVSSSLIYTVAYK